MRKIELILFYVFLPFLNMAQNHIDFRNCLNEGTYHFYEQSYDSAYYYYQRAEKEYRYDFYYEELHLYSRTLWEIGKKRKSLKILKSSGYKNYFRNDTTYYIGLKPKKRLRVLNKMPDTKEFKAPEKIFFDSLDVRDQRYRGLRRAEEKGTEQYDSITRLMLEMDSINAENFLIYVNKYGFPSGYVHCPPITVTFLLHTDKDWFEKNQLMFIDEIKKGNMDPEDYAIVYDRLFGYSVGKDSTIYDRYLSKEVNLTPELHFQNCILIGLSPYYDNKGNRIFSRGNTPKKTRYYEFYKSQKANFNCYESSEQRTCKTH